MELEKFSCISAVLLDRGKMPKAKACSDPQQLCKLLKGISNHGPPEELWGLMDPDKIVECLEEHILDVWAGQVGEWKFD